jgi:phytoene dehydrogenase-like protein
VSPGYRAHFGDGTSFDLSYDMGELKAQLEAEEPGAGGMFFDWLGRARSSLDLGVRAFIEQDSTSVLDFLNPGRVLALALKVNPLELLLSQHWQMSQYFKSPKIRALFSFQARACLAAWIHA